MSGQRDVDAGPTLAGRRVLVVGRSGRLARGIALAARAREARVALATPDGGEDTEGDALPGLSVAARTEAATDELFDRAALLIPGLDTVIVLVAVEPLGALHELTAERWCACAAEPLRQVFWLVRRAVEGFLADAVEGRLVLAVDRVAERGGTNAVVAAALRSLARSFAREYGRRGLACNLVLPAGTLRASGSHDPPPLLTEQILFLASPAASFVNGETVVVRGGGRARARGRDARA
jgi:3-oxoacyl-[acyl-carrier protein] reductase/2-deoxy-D-gluconate 3-dehydrogenase